MESNNLLVFKAISTFVKDLSELYGKQHHPLSLYRRLLEKTSVIHEKAISKHVELFREFCALNREAFQHTDYKLFTNSVVKYSEKVYIDMSKVFDIADKESRDTIWRHLLTISAFVDPSSNAKKMLKEMSEKSKMEGESGKEETFLTSIIEKVEQSITPDQVGSNPMAAVTSIMSSGVFTELIQNMQSGIDSGDLNINKLLGTVQGMIGGLQENAQNSGIDISSILSQLPGSEEMFSNLNHK